MAAKKKTAKAKKPRPERGGTKADFIRKHPDLSAREVVEAAAKAGITIHLPQVYNLRAAAQAPKRGASKPVKSGARPRGSSSTEATFRQLVVELGVPRARALVDQVDSRLRALIEGR